MTAGSVQGPMGNSSARVRQAIGLLGSDPARAEALAREQLALTPEDPEALTVLGTALRVRGANDAGRVVLEPLAGRQPGSWIVQFEFAQVLFALGQSRAAVAPLTRAAAIHPGLSAAWRLLGDIRMASGQLPPALEAYDRFLCGVQRDARLQGAAITLAAGRLQQAESELRGLIGGGPEALAAAHLLAEVFRRQGRYGDAAGLLSQCLERAPEFHMARQSLAMTYLDGGKPSEALAELDRLLARDPGDHRGLMIKAAALTDLGDFAAAAEVTEAVLALFPDQPQAWLVHAHGLRTLGRTSDSIAAFQRCLDLDPDCAEAWWGLANLKTYRFSAEARAALEARLAREDLSLGDRSHLDYTMGKALEDAQDYAGAFEHYAQGAAIQRQLRGYDADRTTAQVRRTRALFTPAFLAERAGWGSPAADPIFIVGLPRSGSTLVEQILASHPAVEGTRELQDIQDIVDWIGLQSPERGPGGYPDQIAALPAERFTRFGEDYLDWTRAQRKFGRARFIDKAPWNVMHIGLIHLMLPQARIIDVRRHPMGCCLSAFKQHFGSGFDFSYDLTDLGRYYADYVDLTAHFDAVLPGRVHRVIYEDLVADTEGEVRRLLDYLGLPFDAACLRFFENDRAVATPSSEQVRRPIFTDAVGQWRHFEPWLGPLKAALGPVLDAYPNPPSAQSAG